MEDAVRTQVVLIRGGWEPLRLYQGQHRGEHPQNQDQQLNPLEEALLFPRMGAVQGNTLPGLIEGGVQAQFTLQQLLELFHRPVQGKQGEVAVGQNFGHCRVAYGLGRDGHALSKLIGQPVCTAKDNQGPAPAHTPENFRERVGAAIYQNGYYWGLGSGQGVGNFEHGLSFAAPFTAFHQHKVGMVGVQQGSLRGIGSCHPIPRIRNLSGRSHTEQGNLPSSLGNRLPHKGHNSAVSAAVYDNGPKTASHPSEAPASNCRRRGVKAAAASSFAPPKSMTRAWAGGIFRAWIALAAGDPAGRSTTWARWPLGKTISWVAMLIPFMLMGNIYDSRLCRIHSYFCPNEVSELFARVKSP